MTERESIMRTSSRDSGAASVTKQGTEASKNAPYLRYPLLHQSLSLGDFIRYNIAFNILQYSRNGYLIYSWCNIQDMTFLSVSYLSAQTGISINIFYLEQLCVGSLCVELECQGISSEIDSQQQSCKLGLDIVARIILLGLDIASRIIRANRHGIRFSGDVSQMGQTEQTEQTELVGLSKIEILCKFE